jgi:diacylglycerol O-acyltransferase
MDKPLQRIDHIMWDAESPNSLATIAGILVFKKKLDKEKLLELIGKRLMRFERFQKKVIITNGHPMWHLDDEFHLPSHIHHIALPGKGGHKELQACISDLISQPLNYNKPLWDMHLIDNYNKGSVLLCRVHHALGDGMALVRVIFSLTGTSAKDSLSVPASDIRTKPKKLREELESILGTGMDLYHDARELISNPALLADTLQNNWKTVKELGELVLGKPVTGSMYKGKLGLSKKAAWTEPLSLDTFKALSKYHKVKINDILLALVAGAIRKHLQAHGQKTTEGLKIVIPINLRKGTEIKSMHNEFGWLSLDLPIHLSGFKARLTEIRKKTATMKPSAAPLLLNGLIHLAADYTPVVAKQVFMEYMGNHIAGAITNVPGPDHPIYLAGEKVEDLVFWIPHTVILGIGISLMSYNGKVYMGIVTDEGLVSDPDMVVDAFTAELNQQEKLLRQKQLQ